MGSRKPRDCLISRPQARRRQFEKMAVGVPEVNAFPPARPFGAAFDRYARVLQPRLPALAIVRRNRKSNVHRPMPVVRRYGAAGKTDRIQGVAAQKQQQHAAMADVISAKPLVAVNAVEPEHLLVERTSTLESLDIERRFQHAGEGGYFGFHGRAALWTECPRNSQSVIHIDNDYSGVTVARNPLNGYC